MAISEESRHELYRRLEDAIGSEAAATLMEHLPPVGWADVVTTRHLDLKLDALEARVTGLMDRRFGEVDRRFGEIDARFGQLDGRLGEMHLRLADWSRTIIYANLGAVLATASLAFAAARLT